MAAQNYLILDGFFRFEAWSHLAMCVFVWENCTFFPAYSIEVKYTKLRSCSIPQQSFEPFLSNSSLQGG